MAVNVPDDYTYLDWAATAPLCREALDAMAPYLVAGQANVAYGMNANSLHAPGRAAFEALELARRSVAADIGAARPSEVIFTSGATEADNAALAGIAHAARDARRKKQGAAFAGHVIVSAIEHEAVLEPARRLAAEGFRVTFLAPDRAGFVGPDALSAALDADTVLVSVQLANSEVGSIQPVAQLARIAHQAGACFHADATQALGKMPLDVGALEVDAASFSAHKVGGPKGVGALYVRSRTPFDEWMQGGGQESGRRSGTQNVCGIAGFAAACKAVTAVAEKEASRERALRDWLYAQMAALPGVRSTVDVAPGDDRYLPNIVHVLVHGLESETMVLRLDMLGYGVSGGSACSSHSLEPSHVLRAMGVSADDAYGALRVSIGRYTTRQQLEGFLEAFRSCLDWIS